MWKIVVGFVVFAAIAMFVLFKGGDIDMGGEKHGIETEAPKAAAPAPAPAVSAATDATAAASAASAASAAK